MKKLNKDELDLKSDSEDKQSNENKEKIFSINI